MYFKTDPCIYAGVFFQICRFCSCKIRPITCCLFCKPTVLDCALEINGLYNTMHTTINLRVRCTP